MRIALVYDLREEYQNLGLNEEALAEFDRPETLDALETALRSAGHHIERVGSARALVAALATGARWDLVFNIAEGMVGRSREALVPALLEAYAIPCLFSDAVTMAITLDKALCKRLARDAGLPTTPFCLLENETDLATCSLPFPLFVKPVAEGSGKGCDIASRVENPTALAVRFRDLRRRFGQPVLAEPFLPGREFTVGIVGNGANPMLHEVAEIVVRNAQDAGIYGFATKEESASRVHYRRVDDPEARMALATGLAIYRLTGCRDAGRIDLRSDAAGIPHFLEINPLPGLHPTLSGLPILAGFAGWSHARLILAMVEAAQERLAAGCQP
ncbi:MAG: D-alanine--D-alanine ligase [Magnetococcales bacterium]|nr:D-alanine--D-alanine ligase [Magnetococcales bacterium]